MRDEAPQRGPVGHEQGEMEQPEPRATADRLRVGALRQLDQGLAALGAERSAPRFVPEGREPEHPTVPIQRALEVRHLQTDHAHPGLPRQAIAAHTPPLGFCRFASSE
jgi:hypothetical protein